MYNAQIISDILKERRIKKKELLKYLGKNENCGIRPVIFKDLPVSELEKIADFLEVSMDTFFIRKGVVKGVYVDGDGNSLNNISIDSCAREIDALNALIKEKDERIESLKEIIKILKSQLETK